MTINQSKSPYKYLTKNGKFNGEKPLFYKGKNLFFFIIFKKQKINVNLAKNI